MTTTREPMLDMFLFETTEMIEQLQQIMMESEKMKEIGQASINEIFRIMHTIKGSSGMMMFDNISHLAHSIEDMFYFIREKKPQVIDYSSLADLVLEGGDLIKEEADRIDMGHEADSDFSAFINRVNTYLKNLKIENGFQELTEQKKPKEQVPKFYITNDRNVVQTNFFSIVMYFEEKCEMENIRGFTVLHKLKEIAEVLHYQPEDILDNASIDIIKEHGFKIYFKTSKEEKEVEEFFNETIFLDRLELIKYENEKLLFDQFQSLTEQVAEKPKETAKEFTEVTEEPKEVTEEPKEVTEEPKEVTEEPKEVAEEPKEIIEEPKEVTEEPKEVTEEPKEMLEEPIEIVEKIKEVIENPKEIMEEPKEITEEPIAAEVSNQNGIPVSRVNHKVSLISVDVHKLDKLMDLVGELVISESMVTNNHELEGIILDDFHKAVRQHRKRISDLQDVVMSIRMVSLSPTLNKMNRIVRDMSKRLDKKVELSIIGEETEVDKNIIEHIGDPLMHIIRNSMDHGIETEEERQKTCKYPVGKITIEAKNSGGDVLIIIKDDGKGLDKEKILQKGIANGMIEGDGKNLSDKEIYATIFSPGLSTNETVTEFSGRGVGMDVVVKEIEKVRGSVMVDSKKGEGTIVTIKIPLTIAILDGMIIRVGKSIFTIPINSIRQSIIVKNSEVFKDLDEKEMIAIRGECFSILRLHELYKLDTKITQIEDGILIMVEDNGKAICIFADELIGQQQVVLKALPEYIDKVKGTSGCTLLGNGSISLILDVSQLVNF